MEVVIRNNANIRRLLRLSFPAIVMPFVFSAVSGLVMGNEELVQKSWSIIAPGSLAGTLSVVYTPTLRSIVEILLEQFSRRTTAFLTGICSWAGFSVIASVLLPMTNNFFNPFTDIGMSAGIGAAVAVYTAFTKSCPGKKPEEPL